MNWLAVAVVAGLGAVQFWDAPKRVIAYSMGIERSGVKPDDYVRSVRIMAATRTCFMVALLVVGAEIAPMLAGKALFVKVAVAVLVFAAGLLGWRLARRVEPLRPHADAVKRVDAALNQKAV